MYKGWSTVRKSLSLIVIKDFLPWVTLSGVIESRLRKARELEKGHQSENLEQISHKWLMILRSQEMISLKVTVRTTIGLIKVVFGNSLMQRHWYYPTTLATRGVELMEEEQGPSRKHLRKSQGPPKKSIWKSQWMIERHERLNAHVAEADSDADDFWQVN
jgi:hypothetical protein